MTESAYRFTHAITRAPGDSVTRGLRDLDLGDPRPDRFRAQHAGYVDALREAGLDVLELPALESYPDSVFIEDAALCLGRTAILTRPGAPSRSAEPAALGPDLESAFDSVFELGGAEGAHVEGGDILLTDEQAFVGLSDRTNRAGFEALAPILTDLGYRCRQVETPPDVLHFKTDCGLLDSTTIFATRRLAASGCFADYRVVEAVPGEEAAANLIRVNDFVVMSAGYPETEAVLAELGYRIISLPLSEAARIDGGPSCLSLRFSRATASS